MKQGDLVTLSARGNKLKCLRFYRGMLGLIIIVKYAGCVPDYEIEWIGSLKRSIMRREELKYAK